MPEGYQRRSPCLVSFIEFFRLGARPHFEILLKAQYRWSIRALGSWSVLSWPLCIEVFTNGAVRNASVPGVDGRPL